MKSEFQSIVLGIVQGLTEFLPVSSTAHLRIVPAILNWGDLGTAYSAIIQLGTMFSVIFYFWNDLIKIYGSLLSDGLLYFKHKSFLKFFNSYESKLGFWILVGTIPICVFGLMFKEPIEVGMVRDLKLIAIVLIVCGVLLYISELVSRQAKTLGNVSFIDVFLIGLTQSLALIPGVSRSGITLFTGLILGYTRHDAARFSFLLSVPAILLSGILELNTLIQAITADTLGISFIDLSLGVVFAFLSGYFAIGFLLKYLQLHKTYIFVVYRIVLGIAVLYLYYRGIIK